MIKGNEQGQSLIFALTILSVLMITIVSVSLFARTDLQSAQKQMGQSSAYYIAEAGLERAVQDANNRLANFQTPASSYSDANFHGGSYQVTLAPRQNSSGEYVGYTIDSIGTYKNETIKLSAWAREPLGSDLDALNFAIFGFSSVNIQSMSGLLATHKIEVNGNVHGNGSVSISHTGILIPPPNPTINGIVVAPL